MTIPTLSLNDGNNLPVLGLGTYGLRDDSGVASVLSALDAGYRVLDTALNYKNEREVGEAVRASSAARGDRRHDQAAGAPPRLRQNPRQFRGVAH